MKVLVITYAPWRDDISVGNTLTNIFSGTESEIDFANIYFRDSLPNNNLVTKNFHISEKSLLKSIISRKPVGQEISTWKKGENTREVFSKNYNTARRLRWDIFLLMQDCIGLFGKWKSKELEKFVIDFQPDIIFGPLGRIPVTNNLMAFIHDKFSIPIISYPWDDHYSLNKISYSPIFWIKIFIERAAIKKVALKSEILYTITNKMKDEYSLLFKKECKLLFKGYDFIERPPKNNILKTIKMIYMGNIGSGRWQVLSKVSLALQKINSIEKKAELFIYTFSPTSKSMRKKLEISGTSFLMKPVSSDEVMKTMQSSDILLFVEPTDLKERLFFRLSFSTKLVDYFYNAKCILALGGRTESMNYLINNDAAIVELDLKNIEQKIKSLLDKTELIEEYSQKSWNCGFKNHQRRNIQEMIISDFKNVINKYKKILKKKL